MSPPLLRVLAASLLVGVLDLCLAAAIWIAWLDRTTFPRILQSIAAGVLGREAFTGGAATSALGVALHFLIAGLWTSAYAILFRRWAALRALAATARGRVLIATVAGLAVWSAMAFVVLPLSRARAPSLDLVAAVMALGHVVVVGLPIAWLVRERTPPPETRTPRRSGERAASA